MVILGAAVIQLFNCSPDLLLFYSFTTFLQLYSCSPALLLFSSFTNNSKAGEQL
jgi:hypothetical protein